MNYKIIGKYIKELNFNIPKPETFFLLSKDIANYKINIDIKSSPVKQNIIEILTTLSLNSAKQDQEKIKTKIIYSAIIELDNNKISKKEVEEKFSGMINAFSYGAPPHGGIAPGIDRIVMLLADAENIREVTLFPMNQNAQDLMMKAPSEVDETQLKELSIKKDIKKN